MTGNNVIKFPVANKRPQTLEDVEAKLKDVQDNHIAGTVSVALENILQDLQIAGFDFITYSDDGEGDQGQYEADIKMLMEAIRSMLHRYYDRYHVLQEMAHSMEYDDQGELSFAQPAEEPEAEPAAEAQEKN